MGCRNYRPLKDSPACKCGWARTAHESERKKDEYMKPKIYWAIMKGAETPILFKRKSRALHYFTRCFKRFKGYQLRKVKLEEVK